jgi:nitroreductase
VVRDILERALRAPSGGNLQPWRIYALSGEPLRQFRAQVRTKAATLPRGEPREYQVYPPDLWEPFRTRRWECGEDLYASIGIPREDRPARLRQLARNFDFFGAPVGLFFFIDRKLGPPQWADIGMLMQTVMLLAVERGLDTCPQEAWAAWAATAHAFVDAPDDHMLFAGMALGYRDEAHPINRFRTRRDPLDAVATLMGFVEADTGGQTA